MSSILTDYKVINKAIVADFAKNSILPDKPGFYDSPSFIKVEKQSPIFLNNYAFYVRTKTYDLNYLSHAEKEIPFIAKILHNELVKDGRLGACIDISMVLSRILEIEGYWNYIVKGALTIDYPKEAGISTSHFWPIDTAANIDAGHVWLSAPPFSVIDISIKQQPYKRGEPKYLPQCVFEKTISDYNVEVEDICSPDRIKHFTGIGIKKSDILSLAAPSLSSISKILKHSTHSYAGATMKYIHVATTAPDGSLDKITSLRLNKKYGIEIYTDIIKPELRKIR